MSWFPSTSLRPSLTLAFILASTLGSTLAFILASTCIRHRRSARSDASVAVSVTRP